MSGPGRGRRCRSRLVVCAVALTLAVAVQAAPASASTVFSDGLETGDLSMWTASKGIAVQQGDVHTGSWAARATAVSIAPVYAYRQLGTPEADLSWLTWFKVVSQGANSVTLMSFSTSTGLQVLLTGINAKGRLITRNGITKVTTASSTVVSKGVWHELKTRVLVQGSSSEIQVWLDRAPIAALTRTDNLGSTSVGRVYVGDTSKRTFDIVLDDVAADALSADVTPPTVPAGLVAIPVSATEVDLSWSPSSDDTGVEGYTVHRDGLVVAMVSGSATGYQDTKRDPASTYTYSVDAFDGAGNHSATSDPVAGTTLESPTAPAFSVRCPYSHSLPDDPIVHPGEPGASHVHEFFGNASVDAFSTYTSMTAATTLCGLSTDTAGYWIPQMILANGTTIDPDHIFAYYRAGSGINPASVQAFPADLRIVAGGSTTGDPAHVSWDCGQATPASAVPGDCGLAEVRASIVFPSCWDGLNLDSPDHRSHMAYPTKSRCPADHPVPLPKLTVLVDYQVTSAVGAMLSSGDPTTLHADFWNTWQQAALEQAVAGCLNAGVVCGHVRLGHPEHPRRVGVRRQQRVHRAQLRLGQLRAVDEVGDQALVGGGVEQRADRGRAVTAGAARLLVVLLGRGRDRPVHDRAHVGLVDAHAKRGRGGDRLQLAGQELLERGRALVGG